MKHSNCYGCKKILPLSEFSYSQRKKSGDGRKCMNCLQPYYASLKMSFPTDSCCMCKRSLPVSQFKFAAKDQKNVCLTCTATQIHNECGPGGSSKSEHSTNPGWTYYAKTYIAVGCPTPIIDANDGHEIYCHYCGELSAVCWSVQQLPSTWSLLRFNAFYYNQNLFSGEPGNIIMCDAKDCPLSFHFHCVGLSEDSVPTGCQSGSHVLPISLSFHSISQASGFAQSIQSNIHPAHFNDTYRGN